MNYYNEFDPKAAAWLRELIKEGLIPKGEIDTRSIRDVQPADLAGFTQCHFFAGIGGWSLALRMAGWPDDEPVWTGSPPCQDCSVAGAVWGVRTGLRGKRSGLAHRWVDLVQALQPPSLFFENVSGITPWLAEIKGRLEGAGYTVSESKTSAGDIGAPHLRRRVWLAANRNGKRLQAPRKGIAFPAVGASWRTAPRNNRTAFEPVSGGMAHGLPGRVGMVRAFGNAIVPQVAAEFIQAYLETL